MRFFMFVVLCAIVGSIAIPMLTVTELNSTLRLHVSPPQARLQGWRPRNLFARQATCYASDGLYYDCGGLPCCRGRNVAFLCAVDLRLICCPYSNASCASRDMCCGNNCCPEGSYCTSALTCAFPRSVATTTSRPSTSTKVTETSTRLTSSTKATEIDTQATSAAKDENGDTPGGGLSRSDKIAIGVGLGVGIPTIIIGLIGVFCRP